MKILITDDEPLIITNIKQIIINSGIIFSDILTAESADDAITIIKQSKPEIVLTDIQMPCRSGLDIIKYLSDTSPDSIAICITGYSDFNYVQTALKFHAFDYILKPIDASKLTVCLQKAMENINQIQKNRQLSKVLTTYYNDHYKTLRRQFLENILLQTAAQDFKSLELKALPLNLNFSNYRLIGIQCNLNIPNLLPNQQYYIAYSVSDYLEKKYHDLVSCFIGNTVYIIWTNLDADSLDDFVSSIEKYMKDTYFTSINIGISNMAQNINELNFLSKQVTYCLNHSLTYPAESIVFYKDISFGHDDYISTTELINLLVNAIQMQDDNKVNEYCNALFKGAVSLSLTQQLNIINIVILNINLLLHNSNLSQSDINCIMDSVSSLRNNGFLAKDSLSRFLNYINSVMQKISSIQLTYKNHIINQIITYINEHYEEQIGLIDIGDSLDRNPSYLSRLLKQELGKGFSQLLTEKRIAVAKQLLETTDMKTNDIAIKAGYPNAKYFHQVFLSNVEMTPCEYRKISSAFSSNLERY